MEDFLANPGKFKPLCPEPPYVYEVWYRRQADKPARKTVRRHDTDIAAMFGAPIYTIPEGEYELPY